MDDKTIEEKAMDALLGIGQGLQAIAAAIHDLAAATRGDGGEIDPNDPDLSDLAGDPIFRNPVDVINDGGFDG